MKNKTKIFSISAAVGALVANSQHAVASVTHEKESEASTKQAKTVSPASVKLAVGNDLMSFTMSPSNPSVVLASHESHSSHSSHSSHASHASGM